MFKKNRFERELASTAIDAIMGGKIFPGNDKVNALGLMSAVIAQDHLQE
jgi:hypothetical protein